MPLCPLRIIGLAMTLQHPTLTHARYGVPSPGLKVAHVRRPNRIDQLTDIYGTYAEKLYHFLISYALNFVIRGVENPFVVATPGDVMVPKTRGVLPYRSTE